MIGWVSLSVQSDFDCRERGKTAWCEELIVCSRQEESLPILADEELDNTDAINSNDLNCKLTALTVMSELATLI